jgi:hypothetical protein
MVKFAMEKSGTAGVAQVLKISSEMSLGLWGGVTGDRSSRTTKESGRLILLDSIELVKLFFGYRTWKTQKALSFKNELKTRGISFHKVVKVRTVPPTDAISDGKTFFIDGDTPKNITEYESWATSSNGIECPWAPESCNVNNRQMNPVPTLIWLLSEKNILVATVVPLTTSSDTVIKSKGALKSVAQVGGMHCSWAYIIPLLCNIIDPNTSTNATTGKSMATCDTTVRGGGDKNFSITQWSRSLVVVLVTHVWQDADPEVDHELAGQNMQSEFSAFEKVPEVQLMQLPTVSGKEWVPEMHLEHKLEFEETADKNW